MGRPHDSVVTPLDRAAAKCLRGAAGPGSPTHPANQHQAAPQEDDQGGHLQEQAAIGSRPGRRRSPRWRSPGRGRSGGSGSRPPGSDDPEPGRRRGFRSGAARSVPSTRARPPAACSSLRLDLDVVLASYQFQRKWMVVGFITKQRKTTTPGEEQHRRHDQVGDDHPAFAILVTVCSKTAHAGQRIHGSEIDHRCVDGDRQGGGHGLGDAERAKFGSVAGQRRVRRYPAVGCTAE